MNLEIDSGLSVFIVYANKITVVVTFGESKAVFYSLNIKPLFVVLDSVLDILQLLISLLSKRTSSARNNGLVFRE